MTKPLLVLSLYLEKIMTDKKENESKTSEKKTPEEKSEQDFSTSISLNPISKESPSDEKIQSVASKDTASANEKKSTMKSPEKVSTSLPKDNTNKQKLSKTAVLSLMLALAASAGVGGLYYWDMKQQAVIKEDVLQQTQQSLTNSEQKTQQSLANIEQRVKQLLAQQQTAFSNRLTNDIERIRTDSQVKITQLEKTVERLSQNQPSDWLLHEAEYLIRIATRTLWLEHDTSAAIGLLQDADMRLKELEDPEFLPIRQLIREDIEQLKLMPTIDNEDIILTLMAMNKQLKNLPVKSELIPENFVTQVKLDLSEDIADWKENITKTWRYFSDSFITINKRSGKEEALLPPQFQQNLRENLSLKLQLVQWSASERKQKLYNQNLNDIQLWIEQYFDMSAVENKNFYQGIEQLKSETVSYDYPPTLSSLNALSKVLADQPLKPLIDELNHEKNIVKPEDEVPEVKLESKLKDQHKSSSEGV
jgi:uroporphyrin-3 C-methyltransferase